MFYCHNIIFVCIHNISNLNTNYIAKYASFQRSFLDDMIIKFFKTKYLHIIFNIIKQSDLNIYVLLLGLL